MGRRFGIKATDVTNYLAFARKQFRRIVLDELRAMTSGEEEFRREALTLLGVKPRMTWLNDSALERLREAADRPDLPGTHYRLVEKTRTGRHGRRVSRGGRTLERRWP